MPNNIIKLRRLNYIKKDNPAILKGQKITSSQALKYAWWFESFRDQLRTGVVTFSFFKEDGSIREAKGTLNGVLIPAEDLPKSDDDNSSSPARRHSAEVYSAIPFYDIDKKGWRSFSINRFIGFGNCYKLVQSNLKEKRSKRENYADAY